MQIEKLEKLFSSYKENRLKNRYLSYSDIQPLLNEYKAYIIKIGESALGNSINAIKIGRGSKKILMWSQMHGNESTTTKAVFDVLNAIKNNSSINDSVLTKCTLFIIPQLNPDGANAYTRLNANGEDLNRDAQNLTQPESLALKIVFDTFKPEFCFNLHGQRTMYNVENTGNSAVISFLAPAQDKKLSITKNRKLAMSIIAKLNANLQNQIPNHVGIYDDAFNINCVGDTFQSFGVPTVLFEAGHFPGDYAREKTREYVFQSLLLAIFLVSKNQIKEENYKDYLKIPENGKQFFDIIIKDAKINNSDALTDIGINYDETLKGESIDFVPKIVAIKSLKKFFGHKVIDAKGNKLENPENEQFIENVVVETIIINNEVFSLKIN